MIRPAEKEDAFAVASIHVKAWQRAYRGIVPDKWLDSLSAPAREARWKKIISDGTETVLVALNENHCTVGWASYGPCRDTGSVNGEIYGIYIRPESWRKGYGRALMNRAETALRSEGFEAVSLWVLKKNTPAAEFYLAAGFSKEGKEKTLTIGGRKLSVVKYIKHSAAGPENSDR